MFADKITEAREAVDEARNGWFTSAEFDVRLDALIAAVRADEREQAVARLKKLPSDWGQMAEDAIVKAIRNA